jgi:outer membrane protein assembly factor BamD
MGNYRAAAIAYTSLMNEFPDSERSEEYKLKVIKSYYLYALNSVDTKKVERFETVVNECTDFVNRFPESKMIAEVEKYSTQSQNNLKAIQNEQITSTN